MTKPIFRVLTVLLPVALLGGSLALAPLDRSLAAQDIVTQSVKGSFDKVVTRLKREITGHKLVIVKEVPYQRMLGMVGLKTEKMLGFEIFHPRFGKVIYKANPAAFKDVPLRILVRASGGGVTLEYRKPSVVFAPYPQLGKLGQQLDGVFADIVARVAK